MLTNDLIAEILIVECEYGHRLAKEISLEDIRTHLPYSCSLRFGFNAFYNDLLADGMSEHRHSRYERSVEVYRLHIIDESLVDLYLIDRKLLQLVE